MGSVQAFKPNKVASILERLDFYEVRQKGSHKQFRHPDGRGTTVPFHADRDISPNLTRELQISVPTVSKSVIRGENLVEAG